ncbi:WD40 repeat domain-containing protein [Cryptosporangium sp. NPDC048952]|uniref:WD40 repeat domain-containing protein n=1 Tax=Cryptosporangium sp. NPDC048952 TaxID=3363961 RepID=UPI003723155B
MDVLDDGGADRPPRLRLPDVRVPRLVWWAAAATAAIVVLGVVVWTNLPSDTITGARLVATLDDGGEAADIVRSVAFSPDSTMLVTGGDTRLPTLWSVAERLPLRTFEVDYRLPVSSVAFSPDGRTVAFVGGPLQLWDVRSGVQRTGPTSGQAIGVTAVAWSREDRIATSDTGGSVHLWDATLTATVIDVYDRGDVLDVTFSPDGHRIAAAGGDGVITFVDVATRERTGTLEGHEGPVLGVSWSADGSMLATAGSDGTVRLWDVADRRQIGAPLTGHDGSVYEVAFSPDGRTLASAGEDATARLWDVADHERLQVLREHRTAVYDVAFSPDGTLLATASGDSTTRLWQLERR